MVERVCSRDHGINITMFLLYERISNRNGTKPFFLLFFLSFSFGISPAFNPAQPEGIKSRLQESRPLVSSPCPGMGAFVFICSFFTLVRDSG